jgi:hypothetical protein
VSAGQAFPILFNVAGEADSDLMHEFVEIRHGE